MDQGLDIKRHYIAEMMTSQKGVTIVLSVSLTASLLCLKPSSNSQYAVKMKSGVFDMSYRTPQDLPQPLILFSDTKSPPISGPLHRLLLACSFHSSPTSFLLLLLLVPLHGVF